MKTENNQHIVYALSFQASDIPKEHLEEFSIHMNRIRVYGEYIPDDETVCFYVGETKRHPSERHKEHLYHAKTKSSPEFMYNSRQMIRLCDEFDVEIEMIVLKSFNIGETTSEFEDYYVCQLAASNHPLTNMVKGLTNPKTDIQSLADCRNITEYRAERKRLKNLKNRKTKKHNTYDINKIRWSKSESFNTTIEELQSATARAHEYISDDPDRLFMSHNTTSSYQHLLDNLHNILWHSQDYNSNVINDKKLKNIAINALIDRLPKISDIEPVFLSPAEQLKAMGG